MPVGVSAYVPLATKTLTGTATSVTFSSISQAYRDLVLVGQIVANGPDIYIQFNGDTTGSYTVVDTFGNGTIATSQNYSSTNLALTTGFPTSGSNGNLKVDILDYSTTNKHKTALTRTGNTANTVGMQVARWANTAAISTLVIFPSTSTFNAGSTFTLYGVAA